MTRDCLIDLPLTSNKHHAHITKVDRPRPLHRHLRGVPADDRVLLIVHYRAAHVLREVGESLNLFQSETDLVPIEGNGWSHFQLLVNLMLS